MREVDAQVISEKAVEVRNGFSSYFRFYAGIMLLLQTPLIEMSLRRQKTKNKKVTFLLFFMSSCNLSLN